jgi:hypothetical protein
VASAIAATDPINIANLIIPLLPKSLPILNRWTRQDSTKEAAIFGNVRRGVLFTPPRGRAAGRAQTLRLDGEAVQREAGLLGAALERLA